MKVGDETVGTQITNAIAALDLANTYDAKGAAASALTDAKAYTDSEIARRIVPLTTAEINAAIGK